MSLLLPSFEGWLEMRQRKIQDSLPALQGLWCSYELEFWTSSQSWDQWLFLPGECLCRQEGPFSPPFLLCFLTSVCSAREAHFCCGSWGSSLHLTLDSLEVWGTAPARPQLIWITVGMAGGKSLTGECQVLLCSMKNAGCLVPCIWSTSAFWRTDFCDGWRNLLSASLQRVGSRCSPVVGISYKLTLHSDMLTSGVQSTVLLLGILWVWGRGRWLGL